MSLVTYHRIIPLDYAVRDPLFKQFGRVEACSAFGVSRYLITARVSLLHVTSMPHVVISACSCASSDDTSPAAASRLNFLLALRVTVDDDV